MQKDVPQTRKRKKHGKKAIKGGTMWRILSRKEKKEKDERGGGNTTWYTPAPYLKDCIRGGGWGGGLNRKGTFTKEPLINGKKTKRKGEKKNPSRGRNT